jgi:hypothetical protein
MTKEQKKQLVLMLYREGKNKVLSDIARETKFSTKTVSKIITDYYEFKVQYNERIIEEEGEYFMVLHSKINYDRN